MSISQSSFFFNHHLEMSAGPSDSQQDDSSHPSRSVTPPQQHPSLLVNPPFFLPLILQFISPTGNQQAAYASIYGISLSKASSTPPRKYFPPVHFSRLQKGCDFQWPAASSMERFKPCAILSV